MKIVAIMGSPHGMKGNTGKLLQSLLQAVEAEGAETTVFNLQEMNLAPCQGCDLCHRIGECAISDAFQDLTATMLKADAVVLASPNYIFSVSAQMKAFFDRCCGLLHVLALQGKYGAAVTTAGGGGCEEVEGYMLRFLGALGSWAVGSTGIEAFKLMNPQTAEPALQKAADLGRSLVEAVRSGKTYPEQEAGLKEREQYFRKLVESQKDRWGYEYQVWQEKS